MPTRTCVGCRVRDAQDRLLRVVAGEGEVLPDPRRRLPGRGAYLHRRLDCLALAERKRAFPRAFRLPGPFGVAAVRARLEAYETGAVGRERSQDGNDANDAVFDEAVTKK